MNSTGTVDRNNEQGYALAELQALEAPNLLAKSIAKEASRPLRNVLLLEDIEASKSSAEFQRTCRRIIRAQSRGHFLAKGNSLAYDVLAKGTKEQREHILAIVKRTVGKQLRRSLGGAASQSSAKTSSHKAFAEAYANLLEKDGAGLLEEEVQRRKSSAKDNACATLAKREREEYTRLGRSLSDKLESSDPKEATDEALSYVLKSLHEKCTYPCRSFLSEVKARAHNGLRVYLRRPRWDMQGLSEDFTFGEVLQSAEGTAYRYGVPFYREESSRLADILQVTEDTCREQGMSIPRTSRIIALVEAGFTGREEGLPYSTEPAGRMMKSRDLTLLRAMAEMQGGDLQEVLFGT